MKMRSVPEIAGLRAPPVVGSRPVLIALLGLSSMLAGCAADDTVTTLDPVVVGMTADLEPSFDQGQLTFYEVKAPLAFPLRAADPEWLATTGGDDVPPYGRRPWVTPEQLRVQLSWTVSNLDPEPRNVELLVDPWNEFGRYWPGVRVIDAEEGELQPIVSGIDIYFQLPGTNAGKASRRHGVFTFEDMSELAADFGTVMAILENPPASEQVDDPAVTYVEHAFHEQNRSHDDPLVQAYVPAVIAGLTGVDIGLRTESPGNIALEVVIELVDVEGDRVLSEDSDDPPLEVPENYITVTSGG